MNKKPTEHDYLTFLRSFKSDGDPAIYYNQINYRDGYFEACDGRIGRRIPEKYLPTREKTPLSRFPDLDVIIYAHDAVEKYSANIMNMLPTPDQLKRLTPPAEDVEDRCGQCNGHGTQHCDLGHKHACSECDGAGSKPRQPEIQFVGALGSVFSWLYFKKIIKAAELFGHEFQYSHLQTHLFQFGEVQIVTTPIISPGMPTFIELGSGRE
jgi:hypothetical protein